jgi:phosphoglycolate phosphatase
MVPINNEKIKLAAFDVAGTTAQDDGLVVEAFQAAMISLGTPSDSPEIAEMTNYVNATMGQRKIDVFMHLCAGDSEKANLAHDRFVEEYINLVKVGKLKEFEGITKLFDRLRENGIAVGITTGFPRDILDSIIDGLNWAAHIDFSVAASEVSHGRPAPDMIFRCIELYNRRFNAHIGVDDVAVIGDTESDIQAGVTAGTRIIAGVSTGAHSSERLLAAGATHVLESAVLLPTIC